MSDATEHRKLAAIMFTDMVGYSALSQRNDKLAQELLEEHRQLLREIFPQFNGIEIKTIGDAFLVEFNSALEAAQCAIEIQRTLAKRNHDVTADKHIELKIGIHIGDVVHRGGDIYGDGVNIASRIEPLAGAGGICVSMDVERQIRNAVETRFEKLAPTELKNISVPMELFRIVLPWERQTPEIRGQLARRSLGEGGKSEIRRSGVSSARPMWMWAAAAVLLVMIGIGWWWTTRKPVPAQGQSVSGASNQPANIPEKSIAVLPLANESGENDQQYFSDGLSEDLITALAQLSGLKVIGRTSSFQFRDSKDDTKTIGEKLGVSHLLQGSVRRAGDAVRISAELVRAIDGSMVWSQHYDRPYKDLFKLQDDITTAVAEALKVKLLGSPSRSDAAPSNNNLEAYNALQEGRFYLRLGNEEGTRKAAQFFERAIEIDPRYALAYSSEALAWRQLAASWLGGQEIIPAYAKARTAAQTALSLSPNLADGHEAMGWIALTGDFDFSAAESEFRKAEELAPRDARPKSALGYLLSARGQLKDAEKIMREALDLDPLAVLHYGALARILIAQKRYHDAEIALRKGLEIQPAAARFHTYLAVIDLLRGDGSAALREAQQEEAGFWQIYALALTAQVQSDRAAADAALQKLIHEAPISGSFQIATVYALRKEPEQVFQWLDRAYAVRDSGLTQLALAPFLSDYRTDPRFAAICRKLKIPVSPPER